MMGFWDAVASAGPYANNLHLAPDRQPHQHPITQFLTLLPNQQCQSTEVIQAASNALQTSVFWRVNETSKIRTLWDGSFMTRLQQGHLACKKPI